MPTEIKRKRKEEMMWVVYRNETYVDPSQLPWLCTRQSQNSGLTTGSIIVGKGFELPVMVMVGTTPVATAGKEDVGVENDSRGEVKVEDMQGRLGQKRVLYN